MIANATVKKVIELLEDGRWSQRQIAQMTGVSRGSVGAIARGVRTAKNKGNQESQENQDEETRIIPPSGPPTRCPYCGRLVQKPCLACQIRMLRNRTKQLC